jgi:hypothetical protein
MDRSHWVTSSGADCQNGGASFSSSAPGTCPLNSIELEMTSFVPGLLLPVMPTGGKTGVWMSLILVAIKVSCGHKTHSRMTCCSNTCRFQSVYLQFQLGLFPALLYSDTQIRKDYSWSAGIFPSANPMFNILHTSISFLLNILSHPCRDKLYAVQCRASKHSSCQILSVLPGTSIIAVLIINNSAIADAPSKTRTSTTLP